MHQVHPYAAHSLDHYFSLDTLVTANFYSAVSTFYDKGWGGEVGREGDLVNGLDRCISLDTPVTTYFYSAVSTLYNKGLGGEVGREGG